MNVDTPSRTLMVAAGVALFCSVMVSLAVNFLRPTQLGLQLLERNRAILEAAELLPPGDVADRELVARFLELDARVPHRLGMIRRASGHFVRGDEQAQARIGSLDGAN